MNRHLEKAGIAILVLGSVALPTAILGSWSALTFLVLASGFSLLWWRERPRETVIAGGGFFLLAAVVGQNSWFPDSALVILALLAGTAALAWRGRAAWVAGAGLIAYLGILWMIVQGSSVALAMFTVPIFLAGTVLRLRREAAAELDRRGRELEEERELFAALAVRHERSRIAAELHDIVGHAISVMIIQAAAGQRLVDHDPARAQEALAAIAESGRQGRADLSRLVDLLGGTDVKPDETGGAYLALIEEIVARAARSGLDVTCRLQGAPPFTLNGSGHSGRSAEHIDRSAGHIAFRVVQESLTNALRHAPGAAVRVLVSGENGKLTVRVENDAPRREPLTLGGTGRGLIGLRERVHEQGG